MHACRIFILYDMKTSIFTHAVTQMSRFSLCVDTRQIQLCLSSMLPFSHCVFLALLWKMNWLEIHGFISGFFCPVSLFRILFLRAQQAPFIATLNDVLLGLLHLWALHWRTHQLTTSFTCTFGRLSLSLVLITTTSTALTVHGVSGVTTNVERGEACFEINSTSCHMRDLTVFLLWYLQKTLQPAFYGHFNQF